MPPLISVVVPSYNQGRWLDACLRSLFDQGDPNLEVIVMDGGSTDESPEVLRRWAPRLAYWQSQKDGGQAAAIAAGFERATGDYLAWLNSDDMHMPWTLSEWRKAFARDSRLELVHGDRVVIDAEGRVLRYHALPFHSAFCLNRCPWTHQETAVWSRGLYERAGGVDPSFRFAMDYDFFARAFVRGRCTHLRSVLGAFRWHDASKTCTQHASIGAEEVARVRRRVGVRFPDLEHPLWFLISRTVRVASWIHARPMLPTAGGTGRARCEPGTDIAEAWRRHRGDTG